jgi:Peptidase family M23/Bacterial Ig-like domain (group 2)
MGSSLAMTRVLRILPILLASQGISSCGDDTAGIQATPEVKITVTPTDLVLTTGQTARLEATVRDAEGQVLAGRVVQWSSSAPDIVSVSSTGEVTALAVGRASIGAHSEQSVGFARVVVQLSFRLPVTGAWVVVTEIGSPAPECVGNEGGLRLDGSRDCSHAGISRYSLDLADAGQWSGSLPETPAPEVVASADGTITDICIQPPLEVTCGTNGPFVLVEHAGGFSTMYAHLDPGSVTLRRKTAVRRGQPLGSMGAWGTSPAPWVHFEVRHENKGASAARVLDALLVSGRTLREYGVGHTR